IQLPKDEIIQELFAQNAAAKIWRVAKRDLKNNIPPNKFPEFVPQEGPSRGRYVLREADFWTCGFFPGSLYTLLEREAKYPGYQKPHLPREPLLAFCRAWSEPLHGMATRTDTHDIGFIVMPALRLDWELTGNRRSLESIITAAYSLASRFNTTAKSIRSWDLIRKKDVAITSMEENFILIIDSLCNLDLLFYASAQTGDANLASIANTHARTLLHTHLRSAAKAEPSRTGYSGPIFSTCHVANIDPRTGTTKAQMTAQGYSNESTWARGQAWAILGYAQTYMWTKECVFLDAACGCAEYFLQRLGDSYKVPAWDFDAPIEDAQHPVLDSSAAAIAANGMLLISEALAAKQQPTVSTGFRDAAIGLVRALLRDALADKAKFVVHEMVLAVEDVEVGATFDGILKNATANNNAGANRRYWNHGLAYADYYLLQFGNQLLRMGL
ncbi:Six-hairpin glycosidase-like protein, partial [Tricladium varicosporioides]